jgi:hypothetical protein
MGVASSLDGVMKRGSLFAFVNAFAVDFTDESYTNIGPFTDEHYISVFSKIKAIVISPT